MKYHLFISDTPTMVLVIGVSQWSSHHNLKIRLVFLDSQNCTFFGNFYLLWEEEIKWPSPVVVVVEGLGFSEELVAVATSAGN